MNLQEIINFLNGIFSKPLDGGKNRHIVFWYDDNEDFIDDIDDLSLDNVKIIKLTPNNAFYTKYYIEKVDTENNILVYSNMKKPSAQEDWLFDIFSYSEEFSTDRTTVIMRDLRIMDESLKFVFKDYSAFFKNKDRITAFKNLGIEKYTEEKVHLSILAVLTKVKVVEFEEIIKALIKDYLDDKHKLYKDIKNFGNEEALWKLISKYYGYNFDEKSLERLMAILLVTNMNENIKFELPKKYSPYLSQKITNCVVFVNHFMNHNKDSYYYDKMEELIGKKLKINSILEEHTIEEFEKCDIFEDIDKLIITGIIDLLDNNVEEYDKFLNNISNRRTLHFYSKYRSEYKAIKWAINLLNKKKSLSTIKEEGAYDMIKSYVKEYSYIDKAYRKFYLHYDRCSEKENLQLLRDKIENVYNNWYLQELSIKWFSALKDNNESWRIDGIKQQDNFFKDFIKYKHKERVFVIISDALRYDCGEELSTLLTNDRKGKVEIDFMQSVLPSYTELGMAALLPNKIIEINEKYTVLVDGINSNGIENRNKILQNAIEKSVAIQFDNIVDMKQVELRRIIQGENTEVVYIYHNTIDAMGDHGATERDVFEACEKAFDEIITLVNKLVNNVSAANIIITADHGYLYKRDAMKEFDKLNSVKLENGEDTRRFILTNEDKEVEGTVKYSMDYLLGEGSNKFVITPRGDARFKVQGTGANYVHGGAMPQEVIVPVIRFKNDRSTSSVNEIRKVKISLTSISRKITNIITYLEFFQDEKIQDKVISQKIKCYFEDEEGDRISNENIIIGDSRSENPVERTYREKFVLKSMVYNKTKQYFLVMQDEEDANGFYERIQFNIDIAIVDEFGF